MSQLQTWFARTARWTLSARVTSRAKYGRPLRTQADAASEAVHRGLGREVPSFVRQLRHQLFGRKMAVLVRLPGGRALAVSSRALSALPGRCRGPQRRSSASGWRFQRWIVRAERPTT